MNTTAAAASLSQSSAYPLRFARRLLDAARAVVATLRDHWQEHIEVTEGSRLCDRCFTVYEGLHCCRHALVGNCADHGLQPLTRAARCPLLRCKAAISNVTFLHDSAGECRIEHD